MIERYDALILRVKEPSKPDSEKTFVKGWFVYKDGKPCGMEIDIDAHPYLKNDSCFGFANILIDPYKVDKL